MVILGGGAALVVDGTNPCTLTTIGHDRAGDVVGFTGSRCGGPGAPVTVAGTDTTVGTVVAANTDLRYAVIKFDVPDLIPLSDYAGIAINGIGPDPVLDSLVCKYGPTTPGICDRVTFDGWPRMKMGGRSVGGDVGAPVTMDGQLVGLVDGGYINWGGRYTAPRAVTDVLRFSAILDDVNAGDGPGSGFVPIGS